MPAASPSMIPTYASNPSSTRACAASLTWSSSYSMTFSLSLLSSSCKRSSVPTFHSSLRVAYWLQTYVMFIMYITYVLSQYATRREEWNVGTDERLQELLSKHKENVIEYEEDQVSEAAQALVDEGFDAYVGIMDGLAAGMEVVGELFDSQEYFVPEVLMCADALYAGLDILRPHVDMTGREEVKGEVVIGVVEGDVHDIGKNLVKMMFEVAGFTVHDLGADVPLADFVEKQISTNSDIVALSAMMTTTMMGMKKAIVSLHEKNPDVKIMIGGAPVTGEIADVFGADGYSENASNAVSEAIKMVGALRRM